MNVEIETTLQALLADLPSEGSRRVYAGDWRRFVCWLAFEDVDVLQARPKHVAAYLARMRKDKHAKAYIAHSLSVIREVYGALVREELLSVNPAREVKQPRMSQEPRAPWLTEDQVKTLLDHPAKTWKEHRARIAVCLLLGLGWRRAEVARMKRSDFSVTVTTVIDENGQEKEKIVVTVCGIVKGGKPLTVGVPEWLWEEIVNWEQFANIESVLLPVEQGSKAAITGDVVYNIVTAYGRTAQVKVTPHALRRTYITLLGEKGVSLKMRQLAVGHVSRSTTEQYDRARDASKNAPGEAFADLVKPTSEADQ